MVDFGAQPPREVRARPYVYQQAVLSSTIPIHASISVETSHSRPAAQQQQPQQQQQQQQPQPTPTTPADAPAAPIPPTTGPTPPRLPTTPAASFVRQAVRPNQAPSARPQEAFGPPPFRIGMRATAPRERGSHPSPQRPPGVTVMGGPHPFGRIPMTMTNSGAAGGWTPVSIAGSMSPMVFMEVRSGNDGPSDDVAASALSPGSNQGEFDDFLPCHSRHLSRASTHAGLDANRQRSAPTTTTASQTAVTFTFLLFS